MRYITLVIAFLIGISAEAQIIRAEPFYTVPEAAVSGNLLLDDYPGAAVAYSLRKLDKDYTGSAIRVRRSNDNTEQDIGFVNNYLDTAAMKTFVGNNNGFVVTWYNQGDSTNANVSQSTAANQPLIISSGVLNRNGGRVAVLWDNFNDVLSTSKAFNLSNNTYFIGYQNTHNATFNYIFSTQGATFPIQSLAVWQNSGGDANKRYVYDGTAARVDGLSTQNMELASLFFPTSSPYLDLYINGSQQTFGSTPASAVSPNSKTLHLGIFNGGGTNHLNGNLFEFVLYNSNQSSNRTAIESNINSFYSIY